MSYRAKALEILKATGRPMTHKELVHDIPGSCGETISRALRAFHNKGLVTKAPQDPTKPYGTKLWSVQQATTSTTSQSSTTITQPTSSTSSGKVITMCLPQNKPTTVVATIQAIEEMMSEKKPFSAHDVTRRLRNMVKDGNANIDHSENGTVFAYGKNVAKIDHEDVKGIVHEYFHTGKMTGWTREMVNDHWEYKEEAVNTNPQPPIIMVVPASDDYNGDPLL